LDGYELRTADLEWAREEVVEIAALHGGIADDRHDQDEAHEQEIAVGAMDLAIQEGTVHGWGYGTGLNVHKDSQQIASRCNMGSQFGK
jgi:hypothetical protein